jgi:hypothetical protein
MDRHYSPACSLLDRKSQALTWGRLDSQGILAWAVSRL